MLCRIALAWPSDLCAREVHDGAIWQRRSPCAVGEFDLTTVRNSRYPFPIPAAVRDQFGWVGFAQTAATDDFEITLIDVGPPQMIEPLNNPI